MTDVIFDGGSPSGGAPPTVQTETDTLDKFFALVMAQLQDNQGMRWPSTTSLTPYLNLAVKEICNVKPEAYTQVFTLPLAPGARQSLPPGALFMVDLESVLDLSGNPVAGVTILQKEQLDRILPGWYSFSSGDTIKHVIEDERNPQNFYVFPAPPPTTTQSVTIICACYPYEIGSDVESNATLFPLDNSYIPAALDFTVGYILREETTIQGAQQKSSLLMQSGYQKLGITRVNKKQSDAEGL